MKRLKNVPKKALSITLALVLLATTFFIFDPGVLKLTADATIGVETNLGLSAITTPQAVAPETVYLKPGADTFQYFSNINVSEGTAAGSKDATGTVSYKNQSSTDTKIYVNNLWHKVGKTGDNYENFAISNLELGITGGVGTQTSITLAGLTATSTTLASGATVIGRGSNSATAVLNTSSRLKNATPGDVYMIEWVVVATINGAKHLSFMYTGIYVPLLTITGATSRGKHSVDLTENATAAGFGFITGAMGYAEKGNRSTAYTGKTFGEYAAPLVGFVGQQNNGTAGQYTIPNCDNGHSSTTNFPDSTPKTIMVVPDYYDAHGTGNDNYNVWTEYSNWGSYTSPVPTGANHGNVSTGGQKDANVYSGVAYEVIDISRFKDFSQIPNLSAGYIRYYHDNGDDSASLDTIICTNAPTTELDKTNYRTGVSCIGVDTGEHNDNEGSWRSRTYGLYSFGGATPSSSTGMYVMFKYHERIGGMIRYSLYLYTGVGLHITSVDKDAQRKGYCAMLNSAIDNVYDSSFSTTYTNMRTQARRLCDPTCINADTVSGCTASEISTKSAAINTENMGSLYFHVPETIYLNPASSNNNFQYYVNYAQGDTASTLAEASATSGNFYFHYKGASKVTALYVESVSGASLSSLTVGGKTLSSGKISGFDSASGASTANISTTITAGSLGSHADAKLKWTLYYIDKATNTTQSVVAYSYVYTPNVLSTAGAVRLKNTRGAWATMFASGAGWLCGFNTYTANGDRDTKTYLDYLAPGGGAAYVSKLDNSGVDGVLVDSSNVKKNANYANSNSGKDWDSTDDRTTSVTAPTATLYIDRDRYSDFSQIPNLYAGFYVTDNQCDGYESGRSSITISISGVTDSSYSCGEFKESNPAEKHLKGAIGTSTATYNVKAVGSYSTNDGISKKRTYATDDVTLPLSVQIRTKGKLRQAYNYYLENSPMLKPDYFTGNNYSDMMTSLNTVTDYLCNPYNTTAQSTMDEAAANLYNQVEMMKSAIVNPSSSTYVKLDGSTGTVTRSNILASSTAYNRHYSTKHTDATNDDVLISGQGTNPETINYFYGDTVNADKNNYTGYQFKYAEVTKPFDGAALVNALAAKGETTNGKGTISWDASTKKLSFASTDGTDNYCNYPGQGNDISSYYYVAVIPNTQVILSYTTTGTTSRNFAFYAGNDMKTFSSGTWTNSTTATGNVTHTINVPADCYYLTFRFGNQTANSTTTYSNIKITLKTAVPDEVNNANGAGIEWKMYYDPIQTNVTYNPEGGTFNGSDGVSTTQVYYDDSYTVGNIGTSTPAAPTKDGFAFVGWRSSDDGTVYTNGESLGTWKHTQDITFSAQWLKNTVDNTTTGAINGNIVDNGDWDSRSITGIAKVGEELKTADVVNTNGILKWNDGNVYYQPVNMNQGDSYDTFKVGVGSSFTTNDKTFTNENTANINFYPQTNILYETPYAVSATDAGNGIFTETGWKNVTSGKGNAGNSSSTIYGYSNNYANSTQFSNGSAMTITVDKNQSTWPMYIFEFTGTGFDIITKCDNRSGAMLIQIEKKVNGDYTWLGDLRTEYPNYIDEAVNTHYYNGTLYQVPVYHKEGLDYGTYRVSVAPYYSSLFDLTTSAPLQTANGETVDRPVNGDIIDLSDVPGSPFGKVKYSCFGEQAETDNNGLIIVEPGLVGGSGSYDVTIDAVRIYNPAGINETLESKEIETQYANDYELNPTYSLSSEYLTVGDTPDSRLIFESVDKEVHLYDYKDVAPDNEVYIKSGQAYTFTVNGYDEGDTVHVSLRSPTGASATALILNGDDIAAEYPINTATEMYYSIPAEAIAADGTVTISAQTGSSGYLSVCSFKTIGVTLQSFDASSYLLNSALQSAAPILSALKSTPIPEKTDMSFTVKFGEAATKDITVSKDNLTLELEDDNWVLKGTIGADEIAKAFDDAGLSADYILNNSKDIEVKAVCKDGEWAAEEVTVSITEIIPEKEEMTFTVDFGEFGSTTITVSEDDIILEKVEGVWTAKINLTNAKLVELLEKAGLTDKCEITGENGITLIAKNVNGEWVEEKADVTVKEAENTNPGTDEPGTDEPGIDKPDEPADEPEEELTWIQKLLNFIKYVFSLCKEAVNKIILFIKSI